MSLFVTLVTIAMIAIPVVFVVKIVRRVQRISRRFSDPARLQRAFAESAAAALRRAGADPRAVAKVEVLGQGPPRERAGEVHAKAYVSRTNPQLARRAPRLRSRPTQAPIAGLDMGETFRLAEPPEQGEPHVRASIWNWFAVALFAGTAAYYFLR